MATVATLEAIGLGYDIPQERAYGMARGIASRRETTLIKLVTSDGVVGWGEAWGPASITRGYFELVKGYFVRRKLDPASLDFQTEEQASGNTVRQKVLVKQGIDRETAKEVVRAIKDSKMKVQAAIQGDELRVTGKKRDDLQAAIALVRGLKLDRPVQYVNFRD